MFVYACVSKRGEEESSWKKYKVVFNYRNAYFLIFHVQLSSSQMVSSPCHVGLKRVGFFLFVFKFLQEVVRKKIGLSALPETQERKLTVSESGTQTKCEWVNKCN